MYYDIKLKWSQSNSVLILPPERGGGNCCLDKHIFTFGVKLVSYSTSKCCFVKQ